MKKDREDQMVSELAARGIDEAMARSTIRDLDRANHKDEPARAAALLGVHRRGLDDHLHLSLVHSAVQPSCSKSCSACCSIFVATGVLEGLRIAEWLKSDGREHLRAFLEGADAQLKSVKVSGGDADAYRAGPCLFLSRKGSCRIYERRPAACRLYFVASDPVHCGTDHAVSIMSFATLRRDAVHSDNMLAEIFGIKNIEVALVVAVKWGLYILDKGFAKWKEHVDALPADNVMGMAFWAKEDRKHEQRLRDKWVVIREGTVISSLDTKEQALEMVESGALQGIGLHVFHGGEVVA